MKARTGISWKQWNREEQENYDKQNTIYMTCLLYKYMYVVGRTLAMWIIAHECNIYVRLSHVFFQYAKKVDSGDWEQGSASN